LTEQGERDAGKIGERLRAVTFARVLASPLQRAVRTCELAGYKTVTDTDRDLVEWDYGQYEGRLATEILTERPGWHLFRDGCPGGEMPEQVAIRADRIVQRVRATRGNVLLFSSGHILRMFAARWLGLEAGAGRFLHLSTASLSVLSYEHDLYQPVIRLWNDTSHLRASHDASGNSRTPQPYML
jgi:probable phosphoglycerate mutase